MPATIDVTITGTKAAIDKLMAAKDIIEDFQSGLEEVGEELISFFENQVFASQGGAIGIPWAPLASSTQAYKKKHYRQYAAVPLMETGVMRYNSFVFQAGPKTLMITNRAPYFKYHQSTAPRHKIPWRPMMWINQPVKEIIETVITEDLNTKLDSI